MNEQQTMRGPGRPRKATIRVPIHVTLPMEVVEYLDSQVTPRSQFLERVLRERMQQPEFHGMTLKEMQAAIQEKR